MGNAEEKREPAKEAQCDTSASENSQSSTVEKKPVYEKPRLKKYDQIDHVAIYGVE